MSDQHAQELEQLRTTVRLLTERVNDLEWAVDRLAGGRETAVVPPSPPQSVPQTPPAAPPVAAQPPARPAPPAPRSAHTRPVAPPRPSRPPRDWGKLAEQLFAARTLAWAGGVATALGIVLLFVMAASRGWITPSMRVGTGVIVSLGMLAAALDLHRRKWRSDAILAAAGVGIAGLYASLWAATSMYHLISSAASAPLAAAIAGIAVAVGIRIHEEPLAIFGMSGAMLAPVLVSEQVTAAGVLFAAVMVAAAAPLFVRLAWRNLVAAVWMIGFVEALGLLLRSATHIGFGTPVAAAAVMAALFVGHAFLLELSPTGRGRLTTLGSLVVAGAFTVSLGDAFLFGGSRLTDGHSLAGITLAGLALVWVLLAAVPYAVRRPHADLTDGLVGFGLTSAAIATGLLIGGPGLVCAWTAESAMLVLLGERISRRSGTRRVRATIAAGIYLALGIGEAMRALLQAGLPHVGAGSTGGSVALAAVTLAGIVFCFGVRWLKRSETAAAWIVPAVPLAVLPLWALPAGWAVVAYAGMAAALLVYRRTRLLVSWMPEWVALLAASAWWLAGAALTVVLTAPAHELFSAWSELGERHGLPGLGALLASGLVFAWSVRRPARQLCEYGLVVPLATLAYVIAEAVPAPYPMWAWLGVAGLLAASAQLAAVRERVTLNPLMTGAGSMLALGLLAAWARDNSLQAIGDHGCTAGWESIAIGTAAALLFALAFRTRYGRANALWLPFLLACQLFAMLLPGQYPLVAAGALSVIVSAIVLLWPGALGGRLDRPAVGAIGTVSAGVLAVLVLMVYETPRMLFETSHTPAAGLAAALAATLALVAAAAAARELRWMFGRVPAGALMVAAGGAFALWTLAAGILGAEQMLADASNAASVHDHFQQGHVLVSISWVLVGLVLVVGSLRSRRRELRIGGISLLFLALAKLFLYDLAFLTAMARAVSFIATGSVLLLAALLLQRYTQGKGSVGDDTPEVTA